MKSRVTVLALWSIMVVFLISSLVFGQRRERPPWEERSPKVGKKVPNVQVYDENLNRIQFANLYQDTLLVIQWGGCT